METPAGASDQSARRRTRRRRPRRKSVLLAAASVLLAAAGIGIASAANLSVTSANPYVTSPSRCTNATLSVHVDPTGTTNWWQYNKTAIRIFNYPSACDGRTVVVTVSNASGTALASGSGTCNAPACTITTGSYNATQAANAHALISTWGVPASWDSVCTVGGFWNNQMTCT